MSETKLEQERVLSSNEQARVETDKSETADVAVLENLPEIPTTELSFDLSSFIDNQAETEKIKKRASNVLKLTEENEKLKAELKAMTDRLEAAERRREQLARREQSIIEE